MKDIFSFLECCNPKIETETILTKSSLKKFKNSTLSLKEKERKKRKEEKNPFDENRETSESQEIISPRFIENGIIIENKSYNSENQKKKTYSSILSFSNFPINPIIEDKGIIGPKILLSGDLFFGKEIIITSNGMINGLREKNDGLTFFGLKNTTDYRGIYYNDFVINYQLENNEKKKNSTERVFNISFQKKTKDFSLYMIHDSIIIYYEINNFVYLNNDKDYYLLLGNIFITIITMKNNKENTPKEIKIEIENEDGKNNDNYNFNQNDCPITLGRNDCKINISKPSISKIHAIIDFSEQCNLFYFKDLGSTNGSVLLIKEDDNLKIKGEMDFKLENIPFKIMELP